MDCKAGNNGHKHQLCLMPFSSQFLIRCVSVGKDEECVFDFHGALKTEYVNSIKRGSLTYREIVENSLILSVRATTSATNARHRLLARTMEVEALND